MCHVPCWLNQGLNIQFRVLVPIHNGSGGSNVLCAHGTVDSGLSAVAGNFKLAMSQVIERSGSEVNLGGSKACAVRQSHSGQRTPAIASKLESWNEALAL